MVEIKELQLNILKISADEVGFEIVFDGKKTKHHAKIVDNQGIFGVEFPKKISLMLSYYPSETKSFIGKLREMYFAVNERQAA